MDAFRGLIDDDTLPDDAWKDSFDKLLDERPILRNMNVIKQDVRASFNMNSSYENSCPDQPSLEFSRGDSHQPEVIFNAKKGQLQLPKITLSKAIRESYGNAETISTPLRIQETENPFECTLSPVGIWEFQHFKKKSIKLSERVKFNATPIEHIVDVNVADKASALGNNMVSRRSRKRVAFNSKITDNSVVTNDNTIGHKNLNYSLHPGKWRKSLNMLRRAKSTPLAEKVNNQESFGQKCGSEEAKPQRNTFGACHRKSVFNRVYLSLTNNVNDNNFERELMRRCGQKAVLLFEDAYSECYLKHCCKIGEGAFGEVFLHEKPKGKKEENTVLKIIPIEGKDLINGEPQKSYEQILQEVVICMELCALNNKNRKTNSTPGFVNVKKVKCIAGQYPAQLQKLWEEYDERKESENDHPQCFNRDQLFVVLEMAFSGDDLECFVFQNAQQSFYALHQIIYTLAVGEEEYQFEHRDLHWGNVLVVKTKNKYISYKLDDKILTLPTNGIRITIIDYTLSRITYDNGCYYNDLSCDPELFTATGDYQFDIYRMMREALIDKWEKFEPKTNIFWISYIISKMLDGVSYNKTQQKVHLQYMNKLKDLNSSILTYASCRDCAVDLSAKLN